MFSTSLLFRIGQISHNKVIVTLVNKKQKERRLSYKKRVSSSSSYSSSDRKDLLSMFFDVIKIIANFFYFTSMVLKHTI